MSSSTKGTTEEKLSSSTKGFQAHRCEFSFIQASQHSSGDFLLSKPCGHLFRDDSGGWVQGGVTWGNGRKSMGNCGERIRSYIGEL